MKTLLEDELREVRRRLGDLADDRPDGLGGTLGDLQDFAAATQVQHVSASEHEALTRKGRLIELALERLAEGRWGICEDCRQPIGAKRLEVLPWAPRCVACQGNREVRAAKARAEQLPLRLLARPRREIERIDL